MLKSLEIYTLERYCQMSSRKFRVMMHGNGECTRNRHVEVWHASDRSNDLAWADLGPYFVVVNSIKRYLAALLQQLTIQFQILVNWIGLQGCMEDIICIFMYASLSFLGTGMIKRYYPCPLAVWQGLEMVATSSTICAND